MTKRPERIKIISKRYQIEWCAPGETSLSVEQAGECDPCSQVIKVESGMPEDSERDTLLHEVVHAIDAEMDLDLTEKQVLGISKGILAVLMDNSSFRRYLLRKS